MPTIARIWKQTVDLQKLVVYINSLVYVSLNLTFPELYMVVGMSTRHCFSSIVSWSIWVKIGFEKSIFFNAFWCKR